jgi:DNA-binding CsgD family transcriptional regulator
VAVEDAGYDGKQVRPLADRVYESSISESARDDVLAVLGKAQELLTFQHCPTPADVSDLPTASTALDRIWHDVRAFACGDRAAADRIGDADDLVPFLVEVKETGDGVLQERAARQSSTLRNVQAALSRFQQNDTVSGVIDATPAIVCTLGFDRAIVSRIHESMWVTEALHVEGDKEWAEEILQVGRSHPERLTPGLFETEIVRRKRALRVTNVQQESRVHRAVADASGSRSYVAAPIMRRAQVIGFLHADRYFHRGELSDFDRDVLAIFSEGFGYALERAIIVERLNDLRESVIRHSAGLGSIMNDNLDTELRLGEPAQPATAAPRPVAQTDDWPSDSRLTRREVDVLKLMAAGDTNARIATKLIISEGTVKSHVKHILRKLRAANRAEAVSIWVNGEHPVPLPR